MNMIEELYVVDMQDLSDLKGDTLHLNGEEYDGDIVFINGYNGYTSSLSDGLMCGVIDNSCFTKGKFNILKDKSGNAFRCRNLRGRGFCLKEIRAKH